MGTEKEKGAEKMGGPVVTAPNKNEIVKRFMSHLGSPTSAYNYATTLMKYCTEYGIRPDDIPNMDLKDVWDIKMGAFIDKYKNTISPKELNVIFCSLKLWLLITGKIESRKILKEFKFDKSSPKRSTLMMSTVDTADLKQIFKFADIDHKIVLGLSAFSALRTSIIPDLQVKHIYPKHYKLINGKVEINKPAILVIPQKAREKTLHGITTNKVIGNKANFEFITIIPTKIVELMELWLNQKEVTKETHLTPCNDAESVRHIKRLYLNKIGKEDTNPYDFRNYAEFLFNRLDNRKLVKHLMGHKGDIESLYLFKYLNEDKEKEYLKDYKKVEDYINTEIFELRGKEEKDKADIMVDFAKMSGVSTEKIEAIRKLFDTGKMSLEQLKEQIFDVSKETTRTTIRDEIRSMIKDEIKNGEK